MATIKPTYKDVSFKGNGSAFQYIWTPVTENDTCAVVSLPEYADRSIQVEAASGGAFGGASVACKGSNDGTNYESLRDPSHTTIAITSGAIQTVLENTVFTQPVASGGSGQSITISMLFHLPHPFRT